ncbi:MAG: 2-oxoglutarate dehydrogenase E1 component [Deltaproteobacteria bacterium]|nr:2-oxoglutarate dehydrogenase E1 component [Deltaproteobacteria bacterium]
MAHDSALSGDNAAYLEALEGFLPPQVPARSIFNPAAAATGEYDATDRQAKVSRLVNSYRVRGHDAARVDPLGLEAGKPHPELDPAYFGLSAADMDVKVSTVPMYGMPEHATVRQVLDRLRAVYCGSVGVEYMNIRDTAQKHWVVEQFERRFERPALDREGELRVLDLLTRADGFERFLGVKFQGNKRFSLEGGESLIPLMDMVIEESARNGVREVVIGMAHRGRLNVLLNVLRKPPAKMIAEFAGQHDAPSEGSGDVKYHLGYSSEYVTRHGGSVHLALCFNPSHLEAVNPVVVGRVRAKMERVHDTERRSGLALLIHGDAAFAGQGIVPEVLNLSDLPGYRTGGTVHIVVNNQIGFTTTPTEGRSTPYSTDVARMLGVPIFHVNGEDPEAVAEVVRIAVEWRNKFARDVIIDMYCFRRHGHNETDEPAYTQPIMYRRIAEHPGVREGYLRRLIQKGSITRETADKLEADFRAELDGALRYVKESNGRPPAASAMHDLWAHYHGGKHDIVDTAVPAGRLSDLLRVLNQVPAGFNLHPKLARSVYKLREEQASGNKPIDWAAGELLAYASLVSQGHRVRLSGQDCGRGTFSHRHAVVRDQTTGAAWCPLQHIDSRQAPFDVFNSLLSEAAVLGFEYGYSLDFPEALVIWEAQFGDFANGAQIIFDNFISSGEAKWNRLSGLTLFLPHGYEGQGPEHSSARIERFLQMCAEGNMQCVNATTPAQIFHLLRRQVMRKVRDPLVVFTPKSLLRTVSSPLDDLARGGFQELIGDGAGRKRVVLCSGKVYYDLLAARGSRDVALVRVEQLYPFPLDALRAELARHPGAEVIWCQEEPKNMGGWPSVAMWCLEAGIMLRYAGRKASAAPATGYMDRHLAEQAQLVEEALG